MNEERVEQAFASLPEHQRILPENAQLGARTQVVNVDTEALGIDTTPQPLNKIRPFAAMSKEVPTLLMPEAQIVMHNLFSCFDRQNSVQEGLIGDLIWGFSLCGTPRELTMKGLMQLESAGYVKFQAPDGTMVSMDSDLAAKAWVRYQPKLLDMVYSGE